MVTTLDNVLFDQQSLVDRMAFRTLLACTPAPAALRSRGVATATATGPGMKRKAWADYVPVYVAVGMIALAAGLGAHLMKQQLMHAPGVSVKKSRRSTLPELAEPERAVDDSDNFIRKSFFRKVAHVQEVHSTIPDTIRGDVFTRKPRAETLKDVGVDPNPNPKPQ